MNTIDEALTEQAFAARAGQCWSSPQEMAAAKPGDYPHGLVDECDDGVVPFLRVWHDREGVWLNA